MTAQRRVRLTFAALVAVTVFAVGTLGRALAWPASPAAGMAVATSGLVAAVAGGLALRIAVLAGGPGARGETQVRERNDSP